jgi:polyhydroxybutyrate depolymerase
MKLPTVAWRRSLLGLALLGVLACASDRRLPGASESPRAAAAAAPTSSAAAETCASDTALQAGISEHSLTSSGVSRRFLVYLPQAYDRRRALPVVFNLHGSGGTPEGQLDTSRLPALADEKRFVVVAPAALDGRWNVPPEPSKVDDVRFMSDTLDALGRMLCVDTRRVYATGFSGGGRMSSQLACDLSDRIAAIAAVGGVRFPGPCSTARSMPVLAFHGTADDVNPYAGGGQPYWGTGVENAIDGWGNHNGCAPRQDTPLAPSLTKLGYGGDGCAEVVLYRIDGLAHSWPGVLDPTRADGTANDILWRFFQDHPLPATD